jgi:predicted negative regulator of RcsB-dependent stress response
MATVEVSKDGDAADPATGVVHTREMILGRNAKRIGDIYRDMAGDAESAKAAYAEARAYYNKALASKPDKEVVDIIQAEMATIPE